MAENRSHAPGTEIGSSTGGINMHKVIAGGAGADFGIGPLPGTNKIAGRKGDTGRVMPDSERCSGISMGRGSMDATRHSDHGPHDHGSVYSKR